MNQKRLIRKVTSSSEARIEDLESSQERIGPSISRVNTQLDSSNRHLQKTLQDALVS